MVYFRNLPLHRGLKMKRCMFGLALASFVSMTISLAPAADLVGGRERAYTSGADVGCSCDAPGISGMVCATPLRCREMSGLCEGGCTYSLGDDVGCSCDAP